MCFTIFMDRVFGTLLCSAAGPIWIIRGPLPWFYSNRIGPNSWIYLCHSYIRSTYFRTKKIYLFISHVIRNLSHYTSVLNSSIQFKNLILNFREILCQLLLHHFTLVYGRAFPNSCKRHRNGILDRYQQNRNDIGSLYSFIRRRGFACHIWTWSITSSNIVIHSSWNVRTTPSRVDFWWWKNGTAGFKKYVPKGFQETRKNK